MQNAPPTLHIFIIHSEGLTQRALKLHGTVQTIRLIAQHMGYVVKPFMMLTPTPDDIAKTQDSYQPRINYDPTGIVELDRTSKLISTEVLSNFEKHMKAWKLIESMNANSSDVFMVLEDDIFLIPDNAPNLVELLHHAHMQREWDLILMGVSPNGSNAPISLINTTDAFKVIPSKEAYLIQRASATKLLSEFATTIKFPFRQQLSWYAQTHRDFRLRNPSKQVTLDGSKLGLTPSTIHDTSILVYNAEYMQLYGYMNKTNAEIRNDIPFIRQVYNSVTALNSPYIMHIYATLLHKAGELTEVGALMTTALETLQQQQGLLNSRNEILNHYIDMCKDMQGDIQAIFSEKSKYNGLV
jgi:hypothetical protein